jgi:hypothetical protein
VIDRLSPIIISLFCVAYAINAYAGGVTPTVGKIGEKWSLVLPGTLAAGILRDYDGFVVPDPNKTNNVWEASIYTDNRLPFIAWGDLSNDGLDDVAIVLVDKSGQTGIFAIYHQGPNGFNKDWEITNFGKEITLATLTYLPRGHAVQYKGMNEEGEIVKGEVVFPDGAIRISMIDSPALYITRRNKKYQKVVVGSP